MQAERILFDVNASQSERERLDGFLKTKSGGILMMVIIQKKFIFFF